MLRAAADPAPDEASTHQVTRDAIPRRPGLCAAALALLAALAAAAAAGPTSEAAPEAASEAASEAIPGRDGGLAPLPRPAGLSAASPAGPAAEPVIDPEAEATLFAMPEIAAETRRALALVEAGEPEAAAAVFDRQIALHPGLGDLRLSRAAVAMLAGDPGRAAAELEAAAAAGAPGLAAALADPLLAPLAADPALAAALAAAPTPEPGHPLRPDPVPAPVTDGVAPVTAANTAWNPASERLEPRLAFPAQAQGDILGPGPKTGAREILDALARRGRAAGNHGDLYDNRDRGHSALPPEAHPQLARTAYSEAARAAGLDYGLNDRLDFGGPTFGNSSTAITAGPYWRSLPREAMTRPDGEGPMRLWQTAAANAIYVHPAHRDYGGARGDLFPANTPYLVVSRGASGSDKPFLEALALTFAAFRPETKARLVEEHMLNSTVQMILRRSQQHVTSRDLYLSGAAHPAAFEGWQVNPARMASLAASIEPDAIPAEARIAVVEETLGTEGVDFFGEGLSERLFDTPQAVARIWRSTTGRRSMVLSAEESRDANGRPLAFDWVLLQGDPSKVTIEPLDGGRRARITIDWHAPFRISEENDQLSARVDIGLFASNGAHDSAPAILSWAFPAHEARIYEPGPDGAPRIVSVDYAPPPSPDGPAPAPDAGAPAAPGAYADPLLFPRADWRDDYAWDAEGSLLGWTRRRAEAAPATFAPDGARLLDPEAGPQAGAVPAAYPLEPAPDGGFRVVERDALPWGAR